MRRLTYVDHNFCIVCYKRTANRQGKLNMIFTFNHGLRNTFPFMFKSHDKVMQFMLHFTLLYIILHFVETCWKLCHRTSCQRSSMYPRIIWVDSGFLENFVQISEKLDKLEKILSGGGGGG